MGSTRKATLRLNHRPIYNTNGINMSDLIILNFLIIFFIVCYHYLIYLSTTNCLRSPKQPNCASPANPLPKLLACGEGQGHLLFFFLVILPRFSIAWLLFSFGPPYIRFSSKFSLRKPNQGKCDFPFFRFEVWSGKAVLNLSICVLPNQGV